jgi:GrpB-like predicted nucleotidyltransferase (UPF0157 family)
LREAAAADLSASGQRDAPIEIVEYDPAWPDRFADERDRLAPLLPDAEIHHFGSTAVPGLAAKAVIDIIALVGDLNEPIEARRLRFRDRLREEGHLRKQYAALKRDLAARNREDRTTYTEAKSSFIERHSV